MAKEKKVEETKKEIKVNQPKIEQKELPKKKDAQYLGGKLITAVSKRSINGKEYNNVTLVDGTAKLLSDEDLEAQISKKPGEIVH